VQQQLVPVAASTADATGDPFDEVERRKWAEEALDAAIDAAKAAGSVPADLIAPDGWRWRVLDELTALSAQLNRQYEKARAKQRHQAWQSRFGGPVATAGGAGIGAILSAVGAGIAQTSAIVGWTILVLGVLFAVAGSVFSANTYVQNRNRKLRYSRLLHDIWDYAYMVLPTAEASDVYNELNDLRADQETAGN
jgi:hypothetical protein